MWNAYDVAKRVWQRFARFKAALNDGVKWQLSLHVRCWRKYRSADRCRRFLHDHRDAPRKMVATFMYKVRLIQGLAKGWIACTRARGSTSCTRCGSRSSSSTSTPCARSSSTTRA